MISVKLPDGSEKKFDQPVSALDVAKSIGSGLAKAAIAARVNERLVDLSTMIEHDANISIITSKSDEGIEILRHSSAHVLAMAVQKIWPGTQVTIGPVVENGFYYDFAFPEGVHLSEADFPKIELEMAEIAKGDFPATRKEWTRSEVIDVFEKMGEHFKVEIIQGIPEGVPISTYHMGTWFDLCVGPHIPSSGKMGAVKLTALAGSYWRGDEKNAKLTRIYGTAWPDKKSLEEYLTKLEEAKKRDHRVLGKQLGLFSFQKEAPAHPFFHPKGQMLFNQLVKFMRRKNTEFGFNEVGTPLVMNVELWHKSGHYDNYRDNMYFTKVDDTDAAVKPMNCPGHCLIYANERHSYRELPYRVSEFGRVHRHERSGVTHGLMRVRSFTQDDAHIFCTREQISEEIERILKLIDEVYKGLGFGEYRVFLSTRPSQSIGSDEMWNDAEVALKNVLAKAHPEYKLNPGDGAFYGPKIDFQLIDSIGRAWQCGTVQLDFSMPARFGLEYVGNDDNTHTPVMIHRAVLGSVERFLGIFIEHFAGHFPLWASPIQARVVNVTEEQREYASEVYHKLKAAGVRVDLDERREKLGYKIREAQLEKTPYMLVVGDKEKMSQTVSPRFWDGKNLDAMNADDFIAFVKKDCGPYWNL